MEAIWVVLGAVLAFGGGMLTGFLTQRHALRTAARLIVLELVSNESSALAFVDVPTARPRSIHTAWDAHAHALASGVSFARMRDVQAAYNAWRMIDAAPDSPSVRPITAISIHHAVRSSERARTAIAPYTVSPGERIRRALRRGGHTPSTS